MTNLTDFIQRELYPRLFDRVPEVFPEMDFQPYRGGWASKLKLNGEPSHDGRKDKVVITPKKPHRAIEQGGESQDLITLYKNLNGLQSDIEAINKIADRLGLRLPEKEDNGQYKAYREKQEKLEALAKKMAKDLQTEKGSSTLEYLQDGRGYEKEFIEFAEFGHVSPETVSTLREIFSYTNKQGEEVGLPYGVGEVYTLAIPYRSGSAIQGFVFRSTLSDEQRTRTTRDGQTYTLPKYKDAFISGAASKRYKLFGLTGVNLSGDKETDKDIVVVEGEIDALRASFAGVKNVVAASGGHLSPEALQEAKRRGVKRVTLLFDTEGGNTPEETEKAQRANFKKAKAAIETIHGQELRSFVAYLQADKANQKQDVDSYLRTHTEKELQTAVDEAKSGALFLFWLINLDAVDKQGGEGEDCTDKNLDEFKSQTLELCNSSFVTPTDREAIIRAFADATGITEENLKDEADRQRAAAAQARQKGETSTLFAEAYRLAIEGKTEEALALAETKLPEVRRISREGEFANLLTLPTTEGIASRRKEKPTGVSTGYAFRHGDEMEELLLPSGALTYVCAPTSHGKSRFLQNLAINLATDNKEGTTLYFSYEESQTDVETELLNVYANVELSANNLRTLGAYYRYGDTSKIKGMASRSQRDQAEAREKLQAFKEREAKFDELLTSGKLRVFYEDYDSKTLIEAIRYIAKQTKVKAVFIDYIQLLHKNGTRLQRKEELKEICKDFMTLAVETRLPIVLAAQLNREASSPLDMAVQNIAEASDIEHSANIVLLLWNSRVKPIPQKSSYYKNKDGDLSTEAAALEAQGFEIGEEGKLYATLAKNRGGARGLEAIFDFCGTTGKIEKNYEEPKPEQANLPFESPSDKEGDLF